PNGTMLAGGTGDMQAKLWDVPSGEERSSLRSPFGTAVTDLVFSADGTLLAMLGQDTRIALWNVAESRLRKVLVGHRDIVASVAFAADRKSVASIAKDGQLIVWDLETGLQRYAINASPRRQSPSTVIRSGDTTQPSLALTMQSTIPVVVDASTGTVPEATVVAADTVTRNAATNRGKKKHRKHHWEGVTALAVSPDGTLLGGVSSTGKIELRYAATGATRIVIPRKFAAAVSGVAFSADSRRLLSVGQDTEVHSWDVVSGNESLTLRGHEHPIRAIAASPSGDLLASAGEDTRIMLWDGVTGKLMKILSGHVDFVNGLAFSPNGKLLASGGGDNRILVWNTETGNLLQTLRGHADEVNALAFSRDGKMLASASEDARVILWDMAAGKQLQALEGHQGPVRALAFGRDGQTLASAGEDSQIIVWGMTNRKPSKIILGVTSAINGLAFSADGASLFTGSEDSRVMRWNVAEAKRDAVLE
ncbi:MAG: hypothetical protein ABIP64_17365, partial [Burkholderiales bacterium]